jgi:hypothetical protein
VHGEQQDIYCSRKKEEEEEEDVGILGIALIILFFCLLLLLLLRDIMFSPFPSGRDFSPKLGTPLLPGRIIALL